MDDKQISEIATKISQRKLGFGKLKKYIMSMGIAFPDIIISDLNKEYSKEKLSKLVNLNIFEKVVVNGKIGYILGTKGLDMSIAFRNEEISKNISKLTYALYLLTFVIAIFSILSFLK